MGSAVGNVVGVEVGCWVGAEMGSVVGNIVGIEVGTELMLGEGVGTLRIIPLDRQTAKQEARSCESAARGASCKNENKHSKQGFLAHETKQINCMQLRGIAPAPR